MRRLFLEHIERHLGVAFGDRYPSAEYQSNLRRARIGLSFFGYGFDTVRYWELPANGALLFAERLPIIVPNDFVDGESAVFFTGVNELEERLDFYLSHEDATEAIARAGFEHARRYHIASARARQMLAWIDTVV